MDSKSSANRKGLIDALLAVLLALGLISASEEKRQKTIRIGLIAALGFFLYEWFTCDRKSFSKH